MPISFLRSSTEINVMMPIIMLETTSEMETNAISIAEIISTISVTELISAPTISVYVTTLDSSPAAFALALYVLRISTIFSLLAKSLG